MGVIVVGELADPHVKCIADELVHRGVAPLVLNAAELQTSDYRLNSDELEVDGLTWSLSTPARGWLRRFAPESWRGETDSGGLEDVERAAWVELLLSLVHLSDVDWLTPFSVLDRAESKILQYAMARRVGAPVPPWVVTSSARHVDVTADWVVKPLGPSEYEDTDGRNNLVFADGVPSDPGWPGWTLLDGAPFILQRRINAEAHFRVVTVGDHAWTAVLYGSRHLDWRKDSAAHDAFVTAARDSITESIEALAITVAQGLGVGFSSQDWIWDGRVSWFVDLNPAGQWLFLPEPVAQAATNAIVDWLEEPQSI